MDKEEFRKKIYSKIDELPTLPAVVPKLLKLIEDPGTGAQDITEAVAHDPALASKVLKVANSAYYGFPQAITDLERAVALLGFNIVKSLAMSLGILQSIPSKENGYHFSQKNLWLHSVAVATALKEMGKKYSKDTNNDHLFMIGLLHDIGLVVLDQFFPEQFNQALIEAGRTEKLFRAEQRIIGVDHGEISGMLLSRWKFPTIICAPITVHHQQDYSEDSNIKDIAMLQIADSIAHIIDLEKGIHEMNYEIPKRAIKVLGLEEDDLEQIELYLKGARDGILAFFNAMI